MESRHTAVGEIAGAMYVPVNAPSLAEDGSVVQFGVMEVIVLRKSAAAQSQLREKEKEKERQERELRESRIEKEHKGADLADAPSAAPGAPQAGSPAAAAAFSFPIMLQRQMAQLGIYFGTALYALRLSDADQQGERLLYRMLPKHIVSQLQKRSPQDFIVESCDQAYVLFSDIVGFTSYCADREPRDVVVMLNSM